MEMATGGSAFRAARLGWADGDCGSGLVRMLGSAAGLLYEMDAVELVRRQRDQREPIVQLDVLDALMGLPPGLPVTVSQLTRREQSALRRAPSGAVEFDDGQAVRRAVAPISARLAVVTARDWRQGLTKAGRFAPFCARAMLLSVVPADWDEARVRAAYFGVGVWVFAGGELRMVLEPEPFVRRRHTAAQWWFAEEAWRQLSACGTVGESRLRSATEAVRPMP